MAKDILNTCIVRLWKTYEKKIEEMNIKDLKKAKKTQYYFDLIDLFVKTHLVGSVYNLKCYSSIFMKFSDFKLQTKGITL